MKRLKLLVLLLVVGVLVANAQTRTITGTITNEAGEPVAGATISQKGTEIKTVSGKDGRFAMSVKEATGILVISHVGMETTELNFGKVSDYSVQLTPQATTLSDVVLVGYGTARRRDLTGAVQRLTRDDLVKDIPTNILQAMQGKAAGVNVTQNDGAPGAGISSILY